MSNPVRGSEATDSVALFGGLPLPQGIDTGEIFYTPAGSFVDNKFGTTNEREIEIAKLPWNSIGVDGLPRHTGDGRQQIDPHRRTPEPHKPPLLGEVLRNDVRVCETKLAAGADNPLAVLPGGVDEKIEVARVSWRTMKGQRITTNKDLVNAENLE